MLALKYWVDASQSCLMDNIKNQVTFMYVCINITKIPMTNGEPKVCKLWIMNLFITICHVLSVRFKMGQRLHIIGGRAAATTTRLIASALSLSVYLFMDGQSEIFVGTQSMIGTRETHSPQFQLEILAKLLCVAGVQYIFVLTHNKSNEALASKDEFIGKWMTGIEGIVCMWH